jgi:hypothetical protein
VDQLLAALIGIVVGAGASGGVQAWLRWHDRRLAGRVAARLILGDLFLAETSVRQVIERRHWLGHDTDWCNRALAVWESQREAFAAAVSAADWTDVAIGYRDIADLRLIAAPSSPVEIPPQQLATLLRVAERVDRASDVTAAYIAPKRERQRILKEMLGASRADRAQLENDG